MRVIAGTRRHLILKTVPDFSVRPTTDRIKETLFNILNPYLAGSRFLDLFSGSGAIGIEALSRGAETAVFVEQSAEALSCIKDNLKTTKLSDVARVLSMDVRQAITKLSEEKQVFDVIFLDPPYDKEWEKLVLHQLASSPIINEDTLIVVEASLETDFSYLDQIGFEMIRQKKYKTNQHVFIRQQTEEIA